MFFLCLIPWEGVEDHRQTQLSRCQMDFVVQDQHNNSIREHSWRKHFHQRQQNVSLIMQSMWQMADFSHLSPVSPLRFTVTQSNWFTLTYAFLCPSASATLAIFKDMRKKRIGDPRKRRHNENSLKESFLN